MSELAKHDKNFSVANTVAIEGIKFHSVKESPFKIYGLYKPLEGKRFVRMPEDVAKTVNPGVEAFCRHTAGGRVRFSTDSNYIAIRVIRESIELGNKMAAVGSAGFDLYLDEEGESVFCGCFQPSREEPSFEAIVKFKRAEKKVRNFTINFPLYNGVDELFVGVDEKAILGEGKSYRHETPIVYYGSSITQGGCVCRPGLAYTSIVSRKLDSDFVNLGFSGSGKAEDTIVDYLASLDMSIFVSDYDHNARNPEYLYPTVRNLYKKVRAANPKLPMVFISRPDFDQLLGVEFSHRDSIERRDAIYSMYVEAVRAGDDNIYFIDGESLFGAEYREECTVDLCHPNDIGHMRMAEVIGHTLSKIMRDTELYK